MTAERKKRIKIIVLCILAALLVFVAVCACVPFLRRNVLHITKSTDTLLPEPDKIICYSGGQSYELSRTQRDAVYEVFREELPRLSSCARGDATVNADEKNFYWEFRYHDRYKYAGSEGPLSDHTFTFDAVVMALGTSGGILINPSLNGKSYEIAGESTRLYSRTGSEIGSAAGMLEGYLVAHMLNDSEWRAQDTTPLESNVFPAKPDEIVVYQGAKSKKLSGKELDQVYTALSAEVSDGSVVQYHGVAERGYLSTTMEKSTCIELRYSKRQKYRSDVVPEEEYPFAKPVSVFYNGCEYDTLLFVWGTDANGNDGLRLATSLDGVYSYQSMPNADLGVNETAFLGLVRYIRDLLL